MADDMPGLILLAHFRIAARIAFRLGDGIAAFRIQDRKILRAAVFYHHVADEVIIGGIIFRPEDRVRMDREEKTLCLRMTAINMIIS